MNRFEALHTLGLEDGASEEDVRLAYYGIEKAITSYDFSGEEHLQRRAEGLLDHARESKRFLLSARSKTAARKAQAQGNRHQKLSVTPQEEKTARLRGHERLRTVLVSYLDNEYSKRRSSILILVGCIVVSFILLRYLRGMPRIVGFAVIGAFAIAGSTILTTSHVQIRKVTPYVLEINDRIAALRDELGLEPERPEEKPKGKAKKAVAAIAAASTLDELEDAVEDAVEGALGLEEDEYADYEPDDDDDDEDGLDD